MAYDPSADKVIKDVEVEGTNIRVRIVQYGEGPKKIAILNQYEDDKFTSKIPRLIPSMAKKVAEVVTKLSEEIEAE